MIHTAPSEDPQQDDRVHLGVLCILFFGAALFGFAAFSLQRLLLLPVNSVFFGPSLFGAAATLRAAYAACFAETIPSRLKLVPSIRYGSDGSRDGLASLGNRHGVVLSNALREQVLAHGGTLQR